MEVHDLRKHPLGYIEQVIQRFPASTYHTHGVNHVDHEVTEPEIERCIDRARNEQADMVMVLNYGVDWFIPNNVVIIEPGKLGDIVNAYEEKRQRRQARFEELAEKNKTAAGATWDRAHDMASVIPFGQPILVGHHSEGRDRRYRGRIQSTYEKAAELDDKAKYYAGKAASAESNHAISSDDPEAITKLKEKITKAEESGASMRAFNKCLRKKDNAGMLALGFSQVLIYELSKPDFCGRVGFADYQMSNNSANIRRMKDRLTGIEKRRDMTTNEITVGGIRIVDNVEMNRLQLFFPGKPSDEIRQALKSSGFRWSPSEGAWQRHRSNWAIHEAKDITAKISKGELY